MAYLFKVFEWQLMVRASLRKPRARALVQLLKVERRLLEVMRQLLEAKVMEQQLEFMEQPLKVMGQPLGVWVAEERLSVEPTGPRRAGTWPWSSRPSSCRPRGARPAA